MTAMDLWTFMVALPFDARKDTELYHQTLKQVQLMYDRLDRDASGAVVYQGFYGGIVVDNGVHPAVLTVLVVENMLEEAQAHDAFTHFFADNGSYRFVEFSFAQLLETRTQLIAAIDARPGCFYAESVQGIRVLTNDNNVEVNIWHGGGAERDSEAGFLRYVYDSPAINVLAGFFFPLRTWVHPVVYIARLLVATYVVIGVPLAFVKLLIWVRSYA